MIIVATCILFLICAKQDAKGFKDIMSFHHSYNPKEDTTTVSILTLQKLRFREIKWPHSYSVTPQETANIYLFFFFFKKIAILYC